MRKTLRCSALASAVALWGCEGGGVIVVSPNRPSSQPPLVASIGRSAGWSLVDPLADKGTATPAVALAIYARSAIDVQQFTIHMIDGSNLGGPMITIPKTELTARFGTTHIAAGMTRTFTLKPSFVVTHSPFAVRVEILCVDMRGVTHFASVQDPLP
jgi:hypothetical protein